MNTNRYKPHLLVLPEDDDNRQIVNGFLIEARVNQRSLQVLQLAGGWDNAFDSIKEQYATQMRKYPECRIVLLIDFDHDQDRLEKNKNRIPPDLSDRVFVIGILSKKPKDICKETGMNLEKIGEELAKNCAENKTGLWDHKLLSHNKPELERMIQLVKPFLF